MHLWGVNGDGETWEYMHFLDNLSEVSVPIETFTELVGYQRHYGGTPVLPSADADLLDTQRPVGNFDAAA